MPTSTTLQPGQRGAKKFVSQYGDRLVCVRYRYDAQKQKRYKTVELMVAEENRTPPASLPAPEQVVAVRVSAPEAAVR